MILIHKSQKIVIQQTLLHCGEIFSKFPDSFQILPGEEVSIQSAVEISNRILKTNEVLLLQINNPNSKRKFVPLKPIEFQPKPTTGHEDDVISLSILSGSKNERSHQIWEWELEEKNVGVNCVWYSFNWVDNCLSGNLDEVHVFVHGFHPCESYVCSVPPPNYNCAKNLVSLSPAVLTELEPFIRKFVQ